MVEKIIEDFILVMKEIGYDKEEILNFFNKKLNGEE